MSYNCLIYQQVLKIPDLRAGLKRRFAEYRRWIKKQILKAKNAPTIHCMGDSHMHVMEYVADKGLFSTTRFEFCIIEGATISGLPNPNSKTQAGTKIYQYIRRIKVIDNILICFGEVDCGYLIWYQSQRNQEPVEKHFKRAVFNYCALLMLLNQCSPNQVIVCSVPPPTIADDNEWGEIANARREVKATQLERTKLTIEFNQRISEFCKSIGVSFIDLDSKLIAFNTGVVDKQYLNKNPLDHHLDESRYGFLIAAELKLLGFK